jgi:methionine-rich copper-binding protein CopC
MLTKKLIVALLSMGVSQAALAHAALLKSVPAPRAAMSHSPSKVRLWFNEKIEPSYATIQVLTSDGKPLLTRPASVDKADPKLLVLELPQLVVGEYTVKYRVMSVDGHLVDYGFTFSVKRAQDQP